MSFYFHPEALAEHKASVQYYKTRQPNLGARYAAEFDQVMGNIIEAPHRFRIERSPDIRTISLRRFPFKIIYRETSNQIQVLAVAHKRRMPGYWAGRL